MPKDDDPHAVGAFGYQTAGKISSTVSSRSSQRQQDGEGKRPHHLLLSAAAARARIVRAAFTKGMSIIFDPSKAKAPFPSARLSSKASTILWACATASWSGVNACWTG